jgi:opacity protein-like surface antigen
MTAFRFASLVPCLVLLTATMAEAQQARVASKGPLENGYMTAAAGASFSDARAATFGVEIGERINSRVQAYAAFHYFDDVFNDQAASNLNNLSNYLTIATGRPWVLQGHDRGLAFSGGARYLLLRGPAFRPYIGGGPGILNIFRKITEPSLGDITDSVLETFGAPDGFIDTDRNSTFRPMAEVVAGVGIAAGRTYVDVGYRYREVFHVESFSFSQFTVGVGMRF